MKNRLLVFVLCLFVASMATAVAQTATGQIIGTVQDSTGALIAGCTVKVTSERTGTFRQTTTSGSGTFVVPSLPAGPYTVEVEHAGFRPHIVKSVEVTVGADHPLRITMQLGGIEATVTVTESAVQVQTSEASISSLVDATTVVQLPLNRRNPLHLLGLIPGVVGHSAAATSASGTATHYIHGDRGRGVLTTLDGVDISDPIIPRGELTNAPVNPDMLQEFRVITALARAEYGRNSGAQVEMITKSGSNEYHGSLYEFVRNTSLDANSFFNNHLPNPFTKVPPIPREVLQQNQFGGTIGGPILKNKLFYFFSYDGTRRKQSLLRTSTALTESARRGLFRFVQGTITLSDGRTFNQLNPALVNTFTGAVRPDVPICGGGVATNCLGTYNIVANDPRGLGLDPTMQALINLYPLPNDFGGGDGLNTADFRWNAPSQAPQDAYALKVDYNLSSKYELSVRYNIATRNDLIGDFINTALPRTPATVPGRSRLSRSQGASIGLKTIVSSSLINDFRIGFTRNRLFFDDTSHPIRAGKAPFDRVPELRTTVMTTPWIYWGGTNRHPEHFQFKDGLSWQRGVHTFRFGGDIRFYRFNNVRNTGSNPQGSGISIFPSVFFTAGLLPAPPGTSVVSNSIDRNRLQGLYNELLGIVAQMDQVMYSNGSQYFPGQGLTMYQRQREYSLYFQDDWRVSPRFTMNLGLRYELFGVPYDAGGLQVVPDRPLDQGPVTFLKAGPGTGREWYKTDRTNFAPALGFAWDPWGNGRTAIRGGYRINYNRLVGWALNVVEQRQPAVGIDPQIRGECRDPNTGRIGACGGAFVPLRLSELSLHPRVTIRNGLPALNPPAPNALVSTPGASRRESPFFFDANFKTARVHQFSLSLQRELMPNMVFEIGYVGSFGRNLFRFVNVNQMELRANGFLQEFVNAKNNLAICRGNLVACRAAAGSTSETFRSFGNLGLPGQVPLPLFDALFSGRPGFTDSSNIGNLDTNALGLLADRMDKALGESRGPLAAFGNDRFFRPNPQFDVAGLGMSNSKSWYNSLQLQIRGNYRGSLQFAANYTFAKSIDDTSNETVGAGTDFDFPFDSKNVKLNKARSGFDVNHVFRAYTIYDLPFGRGRRFGSTLHPAINHLIGGWQMNTIVDASSGSPFTVTAGTNTSGSTFNYFTTAPPADCRPDARGSGRLTRLPNGVRYLNLEDGFSIPAPGTLGTCGRNTFTGPGYFQIDLGIFKSFQVRENWKLEFRTELFNAFNHANFNNPTAANANVQTATFGRIIDTEAPNRILQFALKFNF